MKKLPVVSEVRAKTGEEEMSDPLMCQDFLVNTLLAWSGIRVAYYGFNDTIVREAR